MDLCRTNLCITAAECDLLSELVAGSSHDSSTTIASIGLFEPGFGRRRAVVACSDENSVPVESLTRELQDASNQSGLDRRSRLLALVLVAKDLLCAEHQPTDAELRKRET